MVCYVKTLSTGLFPLRPEQLYFQKEILYHRTLLSFLQDAYLFKAANASHASQAAPHPAGTLETEVISQHEALSVLERVFFYFFFQPTLTNSLISGWLK